MTFTRALPFQSTFPRGERRGPYLIFLSPCRFQSTFPRGERHLCWLVAVKHIHFNPRSLVGNDYIPVGTYTIVEISIHVPSWGTTPGLCLSHTILKISIHVPSWGTTNLIAIPERFPAFQSTFPRGERLKAQYGVGLSIAYFNPRSLVGNDGKFSQIFFVFLCNKYNFSTFYYPFSLFFSVIHVTFLIFVVRILPAFYVYF